MAQGAKTSGKAGSGAGKSAAPLDALSDAVESGAGLPAVARAAATALSASVALIDRSSAVLAVAAASSSEEQKLLSGGDAVEAIELRVADAPVGELRYRARRGVKPDRITTRVVSTLLALELERSRSPEWEADRLAGDFVGAVLAREVTDRGDIVARAAE
jgi:PucR family transcriptional regulator, purine catabolism regulatory protein